MADETFVNYHTTRPGASLPVSAADTILIKQNGVIRAVPATELAMNITTEILDASTVALSVALPDSGTIRYIRGDNTANAITLSPTINGQTIMRQAAVPGPAVQDECLTLQLIGTNWYRVQ